MRIGLLTFNWAVNYGAVLQMYSLYNFLGKYAEPYIINYSPRELKSTYRLSLLKSPASLKQLVKNALEMITKTGMYRKFKVFSSEKLRATQPAETVEELRELVKGFELIVVGSDQVWNYNIVGKHLTAYLLDGVDIEKISYAASLGNYVPSQETSEIFRNNLKNFKAVSVREKEAIKVLRKILDRDYMFTVDPVFLTSRDEWLKAIEKVSFGIPKERYMFIYMLETNYELLETAKLLSSKLNMKVYSAEIPFFRYFGKEYNFIRKIHNLGPLDFLKLLIHSDIVLTNSFHGLCFSLIIGKKFLVFKHSTGNSRLENILDIYGIPNVLLHQRIDNLDKAEKIFEIEARAYNSSENINNLIKASKAFLISNIKQGSEIK